jgi:hypothetical protein
MRITEYVAVPGTGAFSRPDEWSSLGSPFTQFALARGFVSLTERATMPFIWSTDVNFGSGKHADWVAGGAALFYYITSPAQPQHSVPGYRTNVIAHSHGGQVALYAAAYGLKINCLVTIGKPVLKSMEPIIERALPNINRWLCLHSKTDWIQILGSLFDGRLGFARAEKQATRNDEMPKGHSDILRDPSLFPLWVDRGWFRYIAEGK